MITEQFGGLTVIRGEEIPHADLGAQLRRISTLAFRRRFTKTERVAIEWAAVDRPELTTEVRMQAAALRSDLKDQEQAQFIDMDDEDTVTGVQGLEAMGLIEPGRAAQILTSPIQPEELP